MKIDRMLVAVTLTILTACTGTTLQDSWLDPSIKSGQHFKKIAVIVMSRDPMIRRTAEDTLVSRITRTQAVPAYSLLSESDEEDSGRVKARLQEAGVDGVVVMRMIGVDKQTSWVPGNYPPAYGGFGSYWGYAHPMAYSPGYLQTDTIVQVETNVYSLADDKLVYAARSETFNPTSAASMVKEIANAIAADLKKRGLSP
ncbi:MAG TPA: hypothetical protein VML36_01635 [Nitrospiria bacterium]|nr:hypothetical protein [Nitrospiria bacterium]